MSGAVPDLIRDHGGQHAEQQEQDAVRSAEMAAMGYRVIRFWNNEVIENVEGVLQVIMMVLDRPTSPVPSAPMGRRGDNRKQGSPCRRRCDWSSRTKATTGCR